MKGYIYKLTSPNTDMIYIGSTIQSLKRRLNKHKSSAKNNTSSSRHMFEYGDVSIHLIREVECDTQLDLRKQEQIEMNKYDGILCNKDRAYTRKEDRPNYKQSDKYKQWTKHYSYWSNGRGQRTLSILKPLFYDI